MDQRGPNPTHGERGGDRLPSSLFLSASSATAGPAAPSSFSPAGPPFFNAILEGQALALAVALYEDLPELAPEAVDEPTGPPGPPASVNSTSGTIEDIGSIDPADVPPSDDPYLDLNAEYSALGWPSAGVAANCGAPFRSVRACGCSVKRVGDHCDRKECGHNYCRDVNRKRRARDIQARFEHSLKGRDTIYSIFTIPPARRLAASERVKLRPRTKKDGTVEPREEWRWKLWVGLLVEYMKQELHLDYALERSDPAGAKNPGRWHPHVNLLWCRKFELVETEHGRIPRRRTGWLSPEQLGLLKAKWKEIIGQDDGAPIVVWTRYAKGQDARKRGFWFSYMGRTWPEWEEAFPYHCRMKWFGRPEAAPDEDRDVCCRKCGLEVAVVRCGSEEDAEALALRGYAHVLQESRDRIEHLRKMAERRKEVPFRGLLAYVDQVIRDGG